jgi:hypothetical protein
MNSIKQIRLKIAELFEIDPQSGDDARDLAAITRYVLEHYGFLPKPIAVTLEDGSFPEEPDAKKEEARRLADRAAKRASEGNYEKAIGIYKRVLEPKLKWQISGSVEVLRLRTVAVDRVVE